DRRLRPFRHAQRAEALHGEAQRVADQLPVAGDGSVEFAPARIPAAGSRARMQVPVLRHAVRSRRL
ncbi:MAG: hypothetical protein AVDCRST_MAG71-248, partial [uncultured Lysobacter sp.]